MLPLVRRRELLRLPDEPKAKPQDPGAEQQQQAGRKARKLRGKAAAEAAHDAGALPLCVQTWQGTD